VKRKNTIKLISKDEKRRKNMEPDKTNPYQLYCWEFQQSLLNYANGNWFGRLIAFEGEIRISGDIFNQEDFQDSFENGDIKIADWETEFASVTFTKDDLSNSDRYQSGTINSKVKIDGDVNGQSLSGTYTVTHKVKPAFQSKLTNIS
jgi:hypothetical protein